MRFDFLESLPLDTSWGFAAAFFGLAASTEFFVIALILDPTEQAGLFIEHTS
jgi:hypothetical protein